jgi:glycosidase
MMLTFLDNHDMGRFNSAVLGDEQKYLNALTLLFGMRGIPQLYYGNEIGMLGGHDPENRKEFPGGFGSSSYNAFNRHERSDEENLIFDQIKSFNRVRNEYPGIFRSAMIHDLQNNIYLVGRKDPVSNKTLLIAYNPEIKTKEVFFDRVVPGYVNGFITVKPPLKGSANLDPEQKKIIVPGNEAVMFILE